LYLIPHNGLLYSREVFEGRQEDMTPLRPANILDELAEFFAQSDKDFVLILDGLYIARSAVSIKT